MFRTAQFLCQEHAIELPPLLVMCPDLDVPRWLLVLWNVPVRTDRGGEDMGIHPFRTRIAQLRFIVINIEILLLSTNTEAT
jgi:hypothetical protein